MLRQIQPILIKSGGYMRYQSQQMIQEIINGQEIEETEKAFRKRQEKGIN